MSSLVSNLHSRYSKKRISYLRIFNIKKNVDLWLQYDIEHSWILGVAIKQNCDHDTAYCFCAGRWHLELWINKEVKP